MVNWNKSIKYILSWVQQLSFENKTFYLAVSGGKDSMLLAHLMLNAQLNVKVLHCNFKLRGNESDQDEEFVVSWAKSNGIDVQVQRFETALIAQQNQTGIQECARKLRYDFFKIVLKEDANGVLVTAHHLEDRWESALINLTRASGLKGVSNMRVWKNEIFRPLLELNSTEITSLLNEKNIKYREDSSNQSDKYKRNFIRHHITPAFKSFDAFFDAKIKSSFKILEEDEDFFSAALEHWKSCYVQEVHLNCLKVKVNEGSLLFSKGITIFLRSLGANSAQQSEVISALKEPGKGQQWNLGHEYLEYKKDFLWIWLKPRGITEFEIKEIGDLLKVIPQASSANVEYVNKELSQNNILKLEMWDKISPVQNHPLKKGSKLLKVLKDRGVPRYVRDRLFVIKSENANYLCDDWNLFCDNSQFF